jgi:hypothetical protein
VSNLSVSLFLAVWVALAAFAGGAVLATFVILIAGR